MWNNYLKQLCGAINSLPKWEPITIRRFHNGSDRIHKKKSFSREDIYYVPARPNHFNELVKSCVYDFAPTEPHNKAFGLTTKGCIPLFEGIVANSLRFPFSMIVKHRKYEHMIGFRLMSLEHTNPDKNCPYEYPIEDPIVHAIYEFLSAARNLNYVKYDDIELWLRREITFIRPEFRGSGIAKELLHKNIDFEKLRKLGVQGVTTEATSIANQKLLEKCGYVCSGGIGNELYKKYNVELEDGTREIKSYFLDLREKRELGKKKHKKEEETKK